MIKRAILNINNFLKKPNIKIGGHNIKQVSEFKYVGSIIAEDASRTVQKEIQTRIQKASAAFSRLYQRVSSRKTLTLKTKVSMYNTMVLPILTQDCETLSAKQNQLKKMEDAITDFSEPNVIKNGRTLLVLLNSF